MAEQVYVYGGSQGVRPASYSYATYAASADNAVGVQPSYSVSVQQQGQGYTYETNAYPATSLAAAPSGYPPSEYSQQPYAVQVMAASQAGYAPQQGAATYATSPSGSYAVPGANPYATAAVVAPAGATYAPAEQLTYAQPSYGQPSAYGQQQQQPSSAYVQQAQAQPSHVYGQVPVQAPSAQPTAYGVAAPQQYGQPPTVAIAQPAGGAYSQQPPPQQGYVQQGAQPTVVYGQPPGQQGLPAGYGQPMPQPATGYGPPTQPPTGQPGAAYGQPPVQAALTQLPPPQQTAVYVLPSAAPQPSPYGMPPNAQPQPGGSYRPPLGGAFGRPLSPSDLGPYDQRPLNFPPSARGPPGALVGPSVVLNAVLGGPRGGSSFARDRDGHNRGYGGFERGDNREVGQLLEDTVFIQGLPETVTEELLAKHFSAVGVLKSDFKTGKPRVWICRDQATGRPRGDGIVGFEQVQAAAMAIDRFHKSEFLGTVINVRHATKKPPGQQNTPRGRGDDWTCTVANCGNRNFGWRTECNRCKAPRPGPATGDKDAATPLRGAGDTNEDDSDREGSPTGPVSPSAPAKPGAPFARDRDMRNEVMRGGATMMRGGRGGFTRGANTFGRGRGGMDRGRGGPMRGRDRFERRDHPY